MEIWIFEASVCLILLALFLLIRTFQKTRLEYIAAFNETLKALVSEWNKLAQTVNALVTTLPEASNADTEHLRASEGDLPDNSGMSPMKRALYRAQKGR